MRAGHTLSGIANGRGFFRLCSRHSKLGQSKIQNLGVAAFGDKNICRFDVAVHDSFCVRGIQSISELDGQGQQNVNLNRITVDAVLQRLAVEIFHGDESLAVVFADFVDGADVRVIQSRGGARFAAKAFEGLSVLCQIIGKKFEGGEAAELGVFRFVDNTHPTTAEFLDDAVMRNNLAEEGVRAGHVQHILFCASRQVNERDTNGLETRNKRHEEKHDSLAKRKDSR